MFWFNCNYDGNDNNEWEWQNITVKVGNGYLEQDFR